MTPGIPYGHYTFQVEITGSEGYQGSFTKDFKLLIRRDFIAASFELRTSKTSEQYKYNEFTYGTIVPVKPDPVTASYKHY